MPTDYTAIPLTPPSSSAFQPYDPASPTRRRSLSVDVPRDSPESFLGGPLDNSRFSEKQSPSAYSNRSWGGEEDTLLSPRTGSDSWQDANT